MSRQSDSLPGKDVIYLFLNHPTYNWRRLLLLPSHHLVEMCQKLTKESRVKVFIVDDPLFSRARSRKVEHIPKCLITRPKNL